MGNLEERSLWRRALRAYRRGLWLGLVSFERAHGLVEGIALDRLLPCPTDQRDDFVVREPHRRWRAGFVIDALEHDRSDRKSTRLNSSHVRISYAVFCLKKKKKYR